MSLESEGAIENTILMDMPTGGHKIKIIIIIHYTQLTLAVN
jgi:hypothetical protein